MSGVVAFIVLVVCLALGIPIALCIGGAVIAAFLVSGTDLLNMVLKMYSSCDSFTLMAIPFFMFAGALMETGGMSKRLVRFANSLVGMIPGGLAHVQILASAFFAALSGSSPATTAAIGGIMIPEMEKEGYPADFSAGVQAVAGTIGTIIPPSIPMVVYGVCAQVSVGKLFAAGVFPGLLYAFSMMFIVFIISKKRGYRSTTYTKISGSEVWAAFKDAIWALLVPIIILGGIYSGIFTPTESGAIAALYGLLAGMFIYKELKIPDVIRILVKATANTAMVMLIIAAAGAFTWHLTIAGIADAIGGAFASISSTKAIFLALTIVLLLFLGCFMETLANILMVTPIMLPVAVQLGIDPIHYGIIMVMTLSLGMATPPVGENLYIAASIAGIKFEKIISNALPCIIAAIVAIILTTIIPPLSMFLPSLMG